MLPKNGRPAFGARLGQAAFGARLPAGRSAVFGGNDLPRKLVSKKMGAPFEGGTCALDLGSGGSCGNDLLSKLVCLKTKWALGLTRARKYLHCDYPLFGYFFA